MDDCVWLEDTVCEDVPELEGVAVGLRVSVKDTDWDWEEECVALGVPEKLAVTEVLLVEVMLDVRDCDGVPDSDAVDDTVGELL